VRFDLARLTRTSGGFVDHAIARGNKNAVETALLDLIANGGRPISETLVDMGRYYVGQYDTIGSYPRYNRNTSNGGTANPLPVSPLDPAVLCRENFVVLITDGEPSVDANNHYPNNGSTAAYLATFGADYDGDGDSNNAADNGDALDDVAAYLAQEDLVDDVVMPGVQHIITYTGDGTSYSARNADALQLQLQAPAEATIVRSASFTSARVPASRTAFGNGFFNAVFEPRVEGELYVGHLEAYRIDGEFEIFDKDGDNALDPVTGEFLEPHNPFWDAASTLADPNNVRNMYTKSALGSTRIDFSAANLTALELNVLPTDLTLYPNDPNVPFATTEALADAIVEFVRGNDAFDKDRDTNKTERREVVLGDIFHSNPVVIGPPSAFLASETGYGPVGDPNSFVGTYGKRRRVLYAGANDGVFHAFHAGTYRTGDNPDTPNETEPAY